MPKRILIIQGHPDPDETRFCRSLAQSYTAGAREAGHVVEAVDVARLAFPLLRSKLDFECSAPPADIAAAQEAITRAEHMVVIFPLWLGDMPALLKGFFEQTFRPDFAYGAALRGVPRGLLKGKSAHIFVTMGMPGVLYRFFYGAHGVKVLRRNVLSFCGVKPIEETLIGRIDSISAVGRDEWLNLARSFGRKGL